MEGTYTADLLDISKFFSAEVWIFQLVNFSSIKNTILKLHFSVVSFEVVY